MLGSPVTTIGVFVTLYIILCKSGGNDVTYTHRGGERGAPADPAAGGGGRHASFRTAGAC